MPELDSTKPSVPQAVWDAWQLELQSIGVTNPLINFERSSYGQIDLAQSHPGGFSQFVAGRATTLSSLVRDPQSFAAALGAARRIKSQSEKISQQFGVDTLGLIAGVVNLQGDGFDLQLPILIWPIRLTSRGEDYEIEITSEARVNPSLVEAFSSCYSVQVDEKHLLALAAQSTEILPASVIYYLQGLVVGRATAEVQRTLVIANFTTAPVELVRDMKRESSEILAALADESAFARLPLIDVQNVETIADADSTQQRIVARALHGQSFAVETLPGCGYSQTVLNTVAALVSAGKRVVISAARRQTLNELADRFNDAGLPGFGVRSTATWLDVIAAISRHEKAQPADLNQARADRAEAAAHFETYQRALERRDSEFDISIGEALQKLAMLSSMPRAPQTNARIEKNYLLQHKNREPAIALLQRAEELGEFKFGPEDSAWFQAKFDSADEVRAAVAMAKRLRDQEFASLRKHMTEFTERVNFKPADSVEQWGIYLRLFVGIRETLDRFVADVFDRPLTELIIATAPRKETGVGRSQMSGGNRRRLKKLAKEYLRPGMYVADLNAALREVQEQREQWHLYSNAVTAPQVPLGLNDVQEVFDSFISELDKLERHLDSAVSTVPMIRLSLSQLERRLNSLVNDSEALDNLEQRTELAAQLAAVGLEPLKRELARLHTPREHIAVEFDLCWWQSVLEVLLERDSTVLNFNAEQIAAIEAAFCEADSRLVKLTAKSVAHALAERWRSGVQANPQDAERLKALLKTSKASLAQLPSAAGSLLDSIASVVMVSPFEAPAELAGQRFDVAIIMDAAGTTVAENLAVLQRASQVIAFGDDAIASPEGFEIESRLRPIGREIDSRSIFEAVQRSFGFETLKISYRGSGQTLGGLINREFYQNRIVFEPTPADFEGNRSHTIEIITEGANASSTYEGATESPEAEVSRVVELVLEHARSRPEQSLFVASASSVHAERIRSQIKKELSAKPELETFFDSHGAEKFEVVSIADLAHRIGDRIIFSVGFGLTPRGGVSSDFGQLSMRDGRRYLTNTLVSARKQITVVSCITADVIPADGVSAGAKLLKTLLSSSENGGHVSNEATSDSLLADLALRLKKLGARVDSSFAERLPLVVAHGNISAVVMPDWALLGQTLSEKLRLRSDLLKRIGWRYIRVHSFELFSDPQAVALRIAEQLGMQVSKRPQPLFETERAFEDTDAAWGDRPENNDERLRGDVPPHWQ
ncbi:MAG: hypothetical protein RIR24_439 [Actinomycetota bacterium]